MSTHEPVVEHEPITPGSDRAFGLTVGGVLAAVGTYLLLTGSPWYPLALGIALVLCVLGVLRPVWLHPLNVGWTRLGVWLGYVVTPVVMLLIFAVSVVPTALVLRMLGKDPLRLKRRNDATSYWIERQPPGPPAESLRDQF